MFKLIPNTKDFYISEDGILKTNTRLVSTFKDKRGYLRANLIYLENWKVKAIHFLVAITYIGFPFGNIGKQAGDYQVNHIDGNKENNHYSNLEWITCTENIKHAKEHGLLRSVCGENHPHSKLTTEQVYDIRVRASKGETCKSIAESIGFDKTHIRRIVDGTWWKEAPGPITKDHINGYLFEITDPQGNIYKTTNLTGFSREHNLDPSGMFMTSIGKNTNCKGWRVIKTKDGVNLTPKVTLSKTYSYRIISPSNVEYSIDNLKDFCRNYSELSYKTLTNTSWDFKEYKGWTFYKHLRINY
jgi:hypothetical protein